jgi:hypothetical protein
VLRVVPDKGPPAAAAFLDIGTGAIQTFVGDELDEFPAAFEAFDLIAAIAVREALHAAGLAGCRCRLRFKRGCPSSSWKRLWSMCARGGPPT